ncbi:MAG: hypothetical protein IPN92_17730 [Chromatiaceae bacterium]|nr:hypothetical protein [Chromatiaceae bacterium]
MSLNIYFAKPGDTAIAGRNAAFIEALEQSAGKVPEIRVSPDPATADVVLIDDRYQYWTWHYADELSGCGFVRAHAGRLCVINHDDFARPWVLTSACRSWCGLISGYIGNC